MEMRLPAPPLASLAPRRPQPLVDKGGCVYHMSDCKGARMDLEIKCFATLADFAPPDGRLTGMPEGSTVADVMHRLNLPPEEVKITFVNGLHAEAGRVLRQGDRVGLFPAVGGG